MNQRANTKGKLESFLSFSIILVLVAIAAVIFKQQFRFSPAILEEETIVSSPAGQPGLSVAETNSILKQLPRILTPLSPAEVFGPLNLSDKINGKAGLYLSAGFKRLESQRFKIGQNSAAWMEAYAVR